MKWFQFITVCIVSALIFSADAQLLGSGNQLEIQSSNIVRRAWSRQPVMIDENGEISNDNGAVGEKASTDAIDELADNATEIANAAADAITNAMTIVYDKTNAMARACVGIAVAIAPETDRTNICAFVVKTESDGTNDTQWVYYNKTILLKPIRHILYTDATHQDSVKVAWQNWTTNGVSLTYNGKTWNGVHVCTATRPTWAHGQSALDLPNDAWGGANGIDWGDCDIRVGGVSAYTGYITNGVTGAVIYFDNGFLKPDPAGGE